MYICACGNVCIFIRLKYCCKRQEWLCTVPPPAVQRLVHTGGGLSVLSPGSLEERSAAPANAVWLARASERVKQHGRARRGKRDTPENLPRLRVQAAPVGVGRRGRSVTAAPAAAAAGRAAARQEAAATAAEVGRAATRLLHSSTAAHGPHSLQMSGGTSASAAAGGNTTAGEVPPPRGRRSRSWLGRSRRQWRPAR